MEPGGLRRRRSARSLDVVSLVGQNFGAFTPNALAQGHFAWWDSDALGGNCSNAESSLGYADRCPIHSALGISLVAFYVRAVQTEFFPDLPFTHHVEIGFFVALLGFGLGVVSSTALMLEARARTWVGPALCFIVVSGLVLSLSAWTNANAERTMLPPGAPFPPPVDNFKWP